jgi:DNA (cytosine-5)-methyltransferase 1
MSDKLKVLDLFSGIGGFSLGLERTGGFETVAFCEIDPYCRRVLAKHWPNVPIYEDIRDVTAEQLAADGIAVDVICGGFPCQDISKSGSGAGIDGERSGLWRECARLVGSIRPRFVIVENVSALLGRGMGRVLGDLATIRFDAFWECVPAAAIGAPHERDRVWIIAYPSEDRMGELARRHFASNVQWNLAQVESKRHAVTAWATATGVSGGVAGFLEMVSGGCFDDGVSEGVDALGNAVVPQIPELIGNAILAGMAA